MTREEWLEVARRGTDGSMVKRILAAWKIDEELCKSKRELLTARYELAVIHLDARVRELENTWISVEDELPADRQRVLTFDPRNCDMWQVQIHAYHVDYSGLGQLWCGEGCDNQFLDDVIYPTITHWRPLPDGPK